MEDILTLITELGIPVSAALLMGYAVFTMLKFILRGVLEEIQQLRTMITGLNTRVRTMTDDVIKIDVAISHQLGLRADARRLSRSDGKNSARKD